MDKRTAFFIFTFTEFIEEQAVLPLIFHFVSFPFPFQKSLKYSKKMLVRMIKPRCIRFVEYV